MNGPASMDFRYSFIAAADLRPAASAGQCSERTLDDDGLFRRDDGLRTSAAEPTRLNRNARGSASRSCEAIMPGVVGAHTVCR